MAAVVPAKRGPKGPSKVTADVLALVAGHADLPGRALQERIAQVSGVWLSLSYVRQLAAGYRAHQEELTVVEGDRRRDLRRAVFQLSPMFRCVTKRPS